MNKTLFSILLIAMLTIFSSTTFAHEGEDHGEKRHEEGSGGSAIEMDRKSRTMGHEYKQEQGDYSKEYYEEKYGKYEHEKNEMKQEGSGMKEEAMKMQEMQRKEEGGR